MNGISVQNSESITILTLDQPDSKVNVLSRSMWSDLESALRDAATRSALHGLILESAKPSIFIAGADLKELSEVPSADHPPTREFVEQGSRVLQLLESLPFPTAACLDGAALGGGLEVALACDFRISGTNPKAKFGLPEVTLGLIPGWGGTQRLPRIIGVTSAIEVIINNAQLDSESARYRGLVDKVVPTENLRTEASQMLEESHSAGTWRARRERKQRPLQVDRAGFTMEDLSEGKVSEEKSNALSLGHETFDAFRQYVNEQMAQSLSRPAALTALEVIEKGCVLPLGEALQLEALQFLRLTASVEARRLIGEFFASRKR